jgi:rhomboid protease GluP
MSVEFPKKAAPETEPENLVRVTPVVPYFSYIVIACLIAVFCAQVYVDSAQTIMFGGNRSALIAGFYKLAFVNGEYWRVLTGAVLHLGIIHLAFNCYAFFILGRLIEVLSNRSHLPIVFVLAAIGGNLLSLAVHPDGNSVGASGGISGFLGYLTIYGLYRRKVMTGALLKSMLYNVAIMAVFGISLIDKIDNFAHLGGLLAGAAYGIIQIPRDIYKDPRETSQIVDLLGNAGLGVVIFVCFLAILLLLQIIKF